MSADTITYCFTMLLCSGVVGVALIVFGAILPMPLPQPITITMPHRREVLMQGKIDFTGRLAVVNGVKIVLAGIEKPRRPLELVFAD